MPDKIDELLEGEFAGSSRNSRQTASRSAVGDLDRDFTRQRRDPCGTRADPGSDGLGSRLDAAHAEPRAIVLVRRILSCKLENAVDQRLGGRRTTRNVDVDRHDAVAAAHDGIGIVIVAAAVCAGAHRNDPARLRHLVIDLAERRRHLVDECPRHDHDVGLPRTAAEHDAEPVEVIARRSCVHHLDRAAGETESHRPQRTGPRPVHQVVDRRRDEAATLDYGRETGGGFDQSHSSAPFFHS